MIQISDYIQRSKEDRQAHLRLEQPCSEIGGNSSTEFKGLLAYYLGTTIPDRGRGFKTPLCHACGNAKCSNVEHLYWGTAKENVADAVAHGTFLSRYERSLAKYGVEGMKEIAARAGKASGEAKRKPQEHWEGFRSSFDQVDKSKRGWVGQLAKSLGVSHTQIRRIAKRLGY